jgi:hypothetical protein
MVSKLELGVCTVACGKQRFGSVTTIMPSSIPVDVLLAILEHVSKADLVTLCQVNKICCSCSQDVLYRNISVRIPESHVIQILARSTDLAKRVRSFEMYYSQSDRELSVALKNMTSLRHLALLQVFVAPFLDAAVLDGCTFQLDTFRCPFYYNETLRKLLDSQPSLTYVYFRSGLDVSIPFEQTLLPNLTRVKTDYHQWLPILIPGRPVRSITTYEPDPVIDEPVDPDFDSSFFALSTGPLLKLNIPVLFLYPKPASFFMSTFPFLTHLMLYSYGMSQFGESVIVRKTSIY